MRSTLASSSMASRPTTTTTTTTTTTAARSFRPVVAAASRAPCASPAAARASFYPAPLTRVGGKSNNGRMRFSHRSSKNVSASAAAASTVAPPGKTPPMPFVRLAGQEEMKLALLLNVIDPGIGGVLIMGDRGTGKSVAVRAVAELLPQIDVVQDDPFNSHPSDLSRMGPWALDRVKAGEATPLPATKVKTPLVELPLGATEDRICGTIDIEKALGQGIKAYEPGLLARANRGILYVDEVNLLDDGLVDVVLDAAAGGVNTVEREGISIRHPAKFIMIGSGNAAEGELRPQLLDRFGLSVDVRTMSDVKMRSAMVRDRMTYEADPLAFCASVEAEQQELRDKLDAATEALKKVEIPREVRLKISEMCSLLGVDGIRGDITTNRAARALAALEGRAEVSLEDVKRVAGLCLNHRLRKDVLDVIDGGAKVALAWRRVTDPARAEREAKAAAEKEAAAAAEAEKSKKAGSWGGLPSAVPGGGGGAAAAGAAAKKPGSWGGIPGR